MLQKLSDVPRPALFLGLAGLLPFAAGAVLAWIPDPVRQPEAARMLVGYGAIILTFLGGVHWGKAMADRPGIAGYADTDVNWTRLGWSVAPSLIAFAGLGMGPAVALTILIPAFALAFLVDRQAVRSGFFPEWYLPLRKVLTLGVLTCLITALARIGLGTTT